MRLFALAAHLTKCFPGGTTHKHWLGYREANSREEATGIAVIYLTEESQDFEGCTIVNLSALEILPEHIAKVAEQQKGWAS